MGLKFYTENQKWAKFQNICQKSLLYFQTPKFVYTKTIRYHRNWRKQTGKVGKIQVFCWKPDLSDYCLQRVWASEALLLSNIG